jgi:CRP/FNR family cyclic AMP-dependent transcriptional regulator
MPLTTQEKATWLSRIELFAGAAPESIEHLAEVTGEIEFADGRYIVQQGQVGNGLYILVAGSARVVQGDVLLAQLGPGDFFGELAVIDQMPRTASVVAEEPVTCLALASWDLITLLEQDPQLALNMLRELALRVRRADERHHH